MIARVDPDAKTVDLVSFPRDLWVPISPTRRAAAHQHRLQHRRPGRSGAQQLVDTIRADFGIDINHYLEIDFASFKGVIDAVGGLPMYFPTAVRDTQTGFYQTSWAARPSTARRPWPSPAPATCSTTPSGAGSPTPAPTWAASPASSS